LPSVYGDISPNMHADSDMVANMINKWCCSVHVYWADAQISMEGQLFE